MLGKKPVPTPAAPARPAAPPGPGPASAPAPVAPGWSLQILTPDYVVTGYLPPIDMPLMGWLNVPTESMVTLIKAQVMALDSSAPLPADLQAEITVPKKSIVGVIPRDDKSLKAASTQLLPRLERAIIYAGPYILRASFRLSGEMPLRNLFSGTTGDILVVSDAEIHPVQLKANFQPLKTPALLLSKSWVQMYYPA